MQEPRRRMRWLASLAALGAILAKAWGVLKVLLPLGKLAGLLKFGKAAGSILTMFLAIGSYALFWGWKFALGFVLILLVHELGHVAAAAARGIPVTGPLFIPFLGAFIAWKERPRTVADEALLAAGGPAAGLLASTSAWALGSALHSPLLLSLAFTGFYLHVFNLLPVVPLDGGRMVAAVSRWFWFVAAPFFLFYALWRGFILFFLVLWWGWREVQRPPADSYYQVAPRVRAGLGALYLALMGASVVGLWRTGATLEARFQLGAGGAADGLLAPLTAAWVTVAVSAAALGYLYWRHRRGDLFPPAPAGQEPRE